MKSKHQLILLVCVAVLLVLAVSAYGQIYKYYTPGTVWGVTMIRIHPGMDQAYLEYLDTQLKKDSERWGELPTGSRSELVSDIARILDEAITNIDDVSSRDERNPLIAKSLRKLAQAVNSIVAQLKPLSAQAKSASESAPGSSHRNGATEALNARPTIVSATPASSSESFEIPPSATARAMRVKSVEPVAP